MSREHHTPQDPPIQQAVAELQELIRSRYPNAQFAVATGEDPEGVYLMATVDTDDLTTVLETVRDRLVELQVDRALPLYLVPVRPMQRVLAELQKRYPHPVVPLPRLEDQVPTLPGSGGT